VLIVGSVLVHGQNSAPSDIEQTHAFLVKLKSSTTSRTGADDDWQMTPLASEAQTRGEAASSGNWWYLSQRIGAERAGAESANGDADWDRAYDLYLGNAPSGSRGVGRAPLIARGIQAGDIEFIEPDLGFFAPTSKISTPQTTTSSPSKAVIGTAQTRHWPQFSDFAAYQKDEFSQLRSARETVEAKLAELHEEPVRVAFLDTGYDANHLAKPPNVNKKLARNFVEDKTNPDGISLDEQPGLAGTQSHGTGTISILAGGVIELDGTGDKAAFSGPLGGAPFAEIAPMRVATSVVHLENPLIKTGSSGTTRAILYAIRNNCDVISMSHGGLPSRALADAINTAYEAGIAMFFASGDYVQSENENLGWVHSPRYVVYPAAFSRAMCVCGVTADYKTYGNPPSDHYDRSLGPPDSWRLRGNWGPASSMKNAIARVFAKYTVGAPAPTR
jgi:hypothetical protein